MTTLEDVYRKFGEVFEAIHIVETDLGTTLLTIRGIEENLYLKANQKLANEIYKQINRATFGQLLKQINEREQFPDQIKEMLNKVLEERNRLAHSFYREHNFRRNTGDGCLIMLDDLTSVHNKVLETMKALSLLNGVDLDTLDIPMPTGHVKI